jgi:hypothetical protein
MVDFELRQGMSRLIFFLARLEDVIVELRGNGVVMTVFELELETLELLEQKAEKFGEELAQAWFDPFFWHPNETQQLKREIRKKQELRGIMCDDISFLEIRRKGRRRKKYLIKDLLGEGQLFPSVSCQTVSLYQLSGHQSIGAELILVSGRVGTWRYDYHPEFRLSDLSLVQLQFKDNQHLFKTRPVFLETNGTNHLVFKDEDVVTRRSHFTIPK